MRALTVLVGSMLALASANGADPNPVPPLESIDKIRIGVEPGWWLRIAPDGSGRIGFGSSASDSAALPKGIYDFAKLFELLAPVVHPQGKIPDFFSVTFLQRGVAPNFAQYTKRSDIILPLFETGRQKCEGAGRKRILELWQSYSPKPRE